MTSSTSESFFLSSALLASFNRSLPWQGICKPECIVLPLILITAIPVGTDTKTFGFAGYALQDKNILLTYSKIFLMKWDLPQPLLPKRNIK